VGLVTNITKTVQIPNEDATAVIRKLSHTQLKQAAKIRQSEGVGFMKEMGGELLRALRDADSDKIKQIQDQQAADITNYDRDTLLRFGVVSWSYPVKPIADVGLNGLDELDEPTAKFLAESIFEFSRPDTPVEVKNV
jgi:hypothetical protein